MKRQEIFDYAREVYGTVEEITLLDFLDRSYELVESCAGKRHMQQDKK